MPDSTEPPQYSRPVLERPVLERPVLDRPGAQRTRAELLASDLDARIRDGVWSAGQSIGTIESLRAETGFAYSTVSEAVRLLRDRGLLDIRPGRGGGLFVAAAGPVVRMRHTLLTVADEPGAVADAIELRDHLEVLIDVSAARHRTDADVAELRDHLAAMERAETWESFVRRNWALHERIAAVCPNATARAVYIGTLGHLASTSPRPDADAGTDPMAHRDARYRVHVDLVDAVAAGDENAVRHAVARHNSPSHHE